MDGFISGFMSDFNAIKSPNAPKEYGEIAKSIQQKQAQNYAKINAEYNATMCKIYQRTNNDNHTTQRR